METQRALKAAETRIRLACDKVPAFAGKLDDLTMRAHRIGSAMRSGNTAFADSTFIHDLQVFRRTLHLFAQDVDLLPDSFVHTQSSGEYDRISEDIASSIWQWSERLSKILNNLEETARLAHSHIRNSEAKIEAWSIVQETDQLKEKGRVIPAAAQKLLQRFSANKPAAS